MLRRESHPGPLATAQAGAFDPLLFGIFLTIAIAAFILFIYLVQYIYKDAVKKDLNAELWLIIILIAPPIGIILYFIVRNAKSRL